MTTCLPKSIFLAGLVACFINLTWRCQTAMIRASVTSWASFHFEPLSLGQIIDRSGKGQNFPLFQVGFQLFRRLKGVPV